MGLIIGFDENSFLTIAIDFATMQLNFDLTNSNSLGKKVNDFAPIRHSKKHFIDVFIDHSIIEVFISNNQAISRQVFELTPGQRTITFFNTTSNHPHIKVYELMPTN